MKKTTFLRTAVVALAAALLAGCGSSKSGSSDYYAGGGMYDSAAVTESAAEAPMAGSMMEEWGFDNGDTSSSMTGVLDPTRSTNRKIVYTANLNIESTEFDTARSALMDAITACDGYIESTDQRGNAEYSSRYANFTVRVPAEHYREFLTAADGIGNVTYLSENAEDITSRYIDVEARLDTLKGQRSRLEELAKGAETTSDLLEIEEHLADVQYEIENYTRQLNGMKDQVSYSTVYVSLDEVARLTPTVEKTFGERIASAFTEGMEDFSDGAQDFFVGLTYASPVLVVFALIIGLIIFVIRKLSAHRAAKREKRAAAMAAAAAQKSAAGSAAPASGESNVPKYLQQPAQKPENTDKQ